MASVIKAQGLNKLFTNKVALNNFSFELEEGRILGMIGPNGAGKTTALRCLMGMAAYQGHLRVLGKNPRSQRNDILNDVSYIADTAILPKWITIDQLLEYTQGVHPKFDLKRAQQFLRQSDISTHRRVGELSKGMVTQVHLTLAISIDAKLLVLDEPTLGLDIIYRKRFYEQLLNDYFDQGKTILITTHQVEEIEHVLTDLLFIKQGKTVLNMEMESIAEQFVELDVSDQKLEEAQDFSPIYQTKNLGVNSLIFEGLDSATIAHLGSLKTPSVADLFIAKMSEER